MPRRSTSPPTSRSGPARTGSRSRPRPGPARSPSGRTRSSGAEGRGPMTLPFLGLVLLAVLAVVYGFPLVSVPLSRAFGLAAVDVGLGWPRLHSFTIGGTRVHLGLLPLGSSVKLPPRAPPPAPDEPEIPQPFWVQHSLQLATVAVQLLL